MTNQEQYDMLWENTKKVENTSQYIELLQIVRSDSYRLGYIEGEEEGRKEVAKQYEILQKELLSLQKRAAWLQDKLTRTKENYDGQVNNLINKVNYYEELLHRTKTVFDMKGE